VNKTFFMVLALLAFIACLGGYITMAALHLDTAGYIGFLGVLAATFGGAGGVAAWRNTEVIKEQTNGPLTLTHKNVSDLGETVSTLQDQMADISERLSKVNV